MIHTYTYRRTQWVDIEHPTPDDVAEVMKRYHLHPIVAEELIAPTLKPKVDVYDHYLYVVLRFPVRGKNARGGRIISNREIDFVIGKDFIITTRYDAVEPLHNFSRLFEVNSIIDKSAMGDSGSTIFYFMLRHLYRAVGNDLDTLRDALSNAEDSIFADKERDMVFALSEIGRELIDIRQILRPHKDALESLRQVAKESADGDFEFKVGDIISEYYKVFEMVNNGKELVADLRETNNSLLSTKQNEVTKLFTILAFVTFPLSLIAEIFSLDTTHTPIRGLPYDFEIIMGIMLLATGAMFFLFKHKRWL
jgi:magnesium transporter